MDASAALTELVGLSTQVVEAVIVGPDGGVEAAHPAGGDRADVLAGTGAALLDAAAGIRPAVSGVERVHVATVRRLLEALLPD